MINCPARREVSALVCSATRLHQLPQIRAWILLPGVLLALVVALGFSARFIPGYASSELVLDQELSRNHEGSLNAVAMALNELFGPLGGAIMLAAICLFLLIVRRSPVNALAFGSVSAFGWLSAQLIKVIVERPRPNPALLADPLAPETGFDSFPSGHVCLAVGMAFAIYFLARETRWKRLSFACGIAMVVIVALSRLYVGVHYPTDVVAAAVISSSAVLFYCGLWNRSLSGLVSRMSCLEVFGPLPPKRPGENHLPQRNG